MNLFSHTPGSDLTDGSSFSPSSIRQSTDPPIREESGKQGVQHRTSALASDLAVCVWIPLFALRAEELRHPELAHQPAALLSPEDTRRVWQVSPLARRFGVKTGMTVSQAIGLCSALALCEPDPVHYDEQFARLLMALSDVSPVIEPAELGKVFIGVDGLERMLGGPEEQIAAILEAVGLEQETARKDGKTVGDGRERWHRPTTLTPYHRGGDAGGWGRPAEPVSAAGNRRSADPPIRPAERRRGWVEWARLGWARGKFAAWVAAARAKPGEWMIVPDERRTEFLAAQSVAALPVHPDTHHRLWQLGIRTLSEVVRLPEEALASQFGNEGRRAWRLAAGVEDEPVVGKPRPEPIIAALDYLTPVADRGMLAHALEFLVDRALKHPRRAGWRVHALRARAALENGASWMIEAMLKDPSADRERLVAPLRARLEQSPPVGGVERLAVEFTAFAHGTDEPQLFARDAQSSARAGRRRALRAAAHEIRARLKRPMLYHVIEVHPWSRIPERRYALIDFEP
jgi:nucleotidyltransferase/DNA polymerase involved in DNA repair